MTSRLSAEEGPLPPRLVRLVQLHPHPIYVGDRPAGSCRPGFLYAAIILGLRVTAGFLIEAWASLVVIVLVLDGVQLVVMGTLGEYLWRALDLARGRPLYVVASVTNPARPDQTNEPRVVSTDRGPA